MKITIHVGSSEWGSATQDVYPQKSELFCCAEMQEAWKEKVIGYGACEWPYDRDNKTVNIYWWSIYPEGSLCHEMPIKVCPFCGEAIEVEP